VKRTGPNRGANGHAGPYARANGKVLDLAAIDKPVNGHGPSSLERGGISARGEHAASDDESGTSASEAANSSATRRNRRTCADSAASPRSGNRDKNVSSEKSAKGKKIEFPGPTQSEAMQDGPGFAAAVGVRVDLVAASASLLQSTDEKIRKAELDRIRDMKFGKVGAPGATAEGPVLMWDTSAPDPGPTDR